MKYGAYMPAEKTGKASIYRTSDLGEKEIWEIGQEFVAKPTMRILRARGDTAAAVIMDTGLNIIPDFAPHPRHADIDNWPSPKDKKKLLAIEIANEAALTIFPE